MWDDNFESKPYEEHFEMICAKLRARSGIDLTHVLERLGDARPDLFPELPPEHFDFNHRIYGNDDVDELMKRYEADGNAPTDWHVLVGHPDARYYRRSVLWSSGGNSKLSRISPAY